MSEEQVKPKTFVDYFKFSTNDYIRIGLAAIIVGMLFVLYHIQGNTTDVRWFGASALMWMVQRWQDAYGSTADYSHGWLIPLVSLFILWYQRKEIAKAPKKVSWMGLAVVIIALLLHWLGAKAQQPRISLFSLVILLWGIPFYFYGWQVAKLLIFPCSYLIFCIPLNFLDSLTFPLRIFVSSISTAILNGLGLAVTRVGSGLYFYSSAIQPELLFKLEVADPCSGIRSLIAMTAITAAYAWFTQKTLLKKWVLFCCCIPLAVIGNIFRVILIGIAARIFGQDLAMEFHDKAAGYIVFSASIICMIGLGQLLNINMKAIWQRWKQHLLSPTS